MTLYVDESGDHNYGKAAEPQHRYLGLLGVWFPSQEAYRAACVATQHLKDTIFGERPKDKQVILHRSDIIKRSGPFVVLRDPDKQKEFDRLLLKLMATANYGIFTVALDKKTHSEKYARPDHPYYFCTEVLMERYCWHLDYYDVQGRIVAETRGKQEDRALGAAVTRFQEQGTRYCERDQILRTIGNKQIQFKSKEQNITGLQMADMIAQPFRQWILWQCNHWREPQGFGRTMVDAAQSKLLRSPWNSKVEGYGWKALSMKKGGP